MSEGKNTASIYSTHKTDKNTQPDVSEWYRSAAEKNCFFQLTYTYLQFGWEAA